MSAYPMKEKKNNPPDVLTPEKEQTREAQPDNRTVETGKIEETLGVSTESKSRRRWKWIATIAVLLIIAAAIIYWIRLGSTAPVKYQTTDARRGALTVLVTATGDLQAVNTVEVGSEISGLIKMVYVDYNDRVSKNQVLATLDTERLQAEVVQARAQLSAAQASLEQAQATLNEQRGKTSRAEQLAEQNLISREELETSRAALTRAEMTVASAKSQIEVAKAALRMAETTLSKASIRSPIDGIVLSRNVEPGQAVAASFQTPVLFKLAEDLTRMELHVDVDEADVGQVHEDQAAEFTVDAYPDETFPAKITKLYYASKTVEDVVTYEAVLTVDNSDMLLRPGMTATANITTNKVSDALLVPNAALRFTPPVSRNNEEATNPKGPVVWTLKNDKPVSVPLKTGLTDEQWTVVLSGDLQPGEPVLTDIKREQ